MREVDRLEVIREVVGKRLVQREAGERLRLSVRQVKRLVRRYRELGAKGLISGHRGRKASNAIAPEVRAEILAVVRERYEDFSPTLAWEKLWEVHGYRVSVETLRKWMAEAGLWRSKKRRGMRVHHSRPRRQAVGELVQIDGSPHRWFEERGPSCTLIVFIDDATSRLMALRFVEAETTQAYMRTLRGYLDQYGRPVAIYSDKHSIFRVNQQDREGERTQFTRALQTLDIQPIHANTPQAKGRVERANETLQDRLVKELRLCGIHSIDQANAFVPKYMADHNRRFARPPHNPHDAHRPVLHDPDSLDLIVSCHSTRKLSRPRHRVRGLRRSRHPVMSGQDPRLPHPRPRPNSHPGGRREEPPPNRRHRPWAPTQTPQVQTLPRPPLELLETHPLLSCLASSPLAPRPSERKGWVRWFRRRSQGRGTATE